MSYIVYLFGFRLDFSFYFAEFLAKSSHMFQMCSLDSVVLFLAILQFVLNVRLFWDFV